MWNLSFCFITFGAGEGPSSFLENAPFWPWLVASRGYLPPSKRGSEWSFLLPFLQIKWRSIKIDWCFSAISFCHWTALHPKSFMLEPKDTMNFSMIQSKVTTQSSAMGLKNSHPKTLKFELNPELDELSFSSPAIFSNSLVNAISSMWAEKLVAGTGGDFQGNKAQPGPEDRSFQSAHQS